MEYEQIKEKLSQNLSERRYEHSLRVADMCIKLAKANDVDPFKAYRAGLLHDCAKDIPIDRQIELCKEYGIELDEVTLRAPKIIHAPLGAEIARREYEIDDEEILSAIAKHTTGSAHMSMLDKIVFLADLIEPGRTYKEAEEIRELAIVDINQAVLMSFDRAIVRMIDASWILHPNTVEARNTLLIENS